MIPSSASFDSIWQQYQYGQISPLDFLEQSKNQGGASAFAQWAMAKIQQEHNVSSFQADTLKNLADALQVIDREASLRISDVFQSFKNQQSSRKRPAALDASSLVAQNKEQAVQSTSDLETQNKKAKVEFAEIWSKESYVEDLHQLFTQNPAHIPAFIAWSTQSHVSDSDLLQLQRLLVLLPHAEQNDICWEQLKTHIKTIAVLELLPLELRTTMIQPVLAAIQGITDRDGRDNTLRIINEIPQNERVNTRQVVAPMFQGITDKRERLSILFTIILGTQSDRVNTIQIATPLCQDITNGNERASILEAISDIPQNQRANTIQLAAPLCQDITDGYERASILNTINKILQDERANTIQVATPLLQGITDGYERAEILLAISHIPQNQRANTIQLATPLLQSITNSFGRCFILGCLSNIPTNQTVNIISRLIPIAQGISNRELVSEFRENVRRISGEEFLRILSNPSHDTLASLSAAVRQAILNRNESNYSYSLNVVREELENNPKLLLDSLITQFSHSMRNQLSIHYENEAGIDAGGLGRQFISDLLTGVLGQIQPEEHSRDGIYHLKLDPRLSAVPEEEKKIYRQIGQVLMFCLNASRSYPTGILFDESVFAALTAFKEAELEREFVDLVNDEGRFDELFIVYEAMNSLTEDSKQMIERMKPAYAENKKYFVADYVAPALACVFELAKGMKSAPFTANCTWQQLHDLAPQALADRLQGSLSRQTIQEKLFFDERIPAEKQQWLKNWINKATTEQLKQFLYTLTGATSIGRDELQIKDNSQSENAPLYFHTCFNLVDIPFAKFASENEFIPAFEASLAGNKKFSRA